MHMKGGPIIQLKSRRLLDLTTYVVIGVMYLLGARHIADPAARVFAAILCTAFGLLYALLLRRQGPDWHKLVYFGAQTVVVSILLAMSGQGWDFFTFLFFVLAIHAAVVFPALTAAAWIILFYAIAALSYVALHGVDSLVPLFFDVAVFLLCGMFGNNTRQTELALRHNQELVLELQEAQRKLHELAVASERNRLAREIHDGLGHYLTATTMQIQGARALLANTDAATLAPSALAALGKAETLLQEALADVRRSVAALRATPTVSPPLDVAVRQLVDEYRSWTGLDARFDLQGAPQPLEAQVELTLYRVVQEGLTNVRKHAHATSAQVTLAYEPAKIEVLRLVATGATNRAIAETLSVAEGTVRNHLTNILGKLAVTDRTQAALKAKELGLV